MAKRTRQAVETKKPETLIYVGPTISSLSLMQFSMYREGIPAHLNTAVKDCSYLSKLFVPVSELNAARRDINRDGSVLRTMFFNVHSFFNNRKG
ncbi:hypothetical protein KLER11_gp15 [Pararheinheimera phage vB_PsoM_KLER1-1]|nr:hypothetical protein KLER11_gp15 [Pararheinheimera phage vB_PsoM_KLER1-1]